MLGSAELGSSNASYSGTQQRSQRAGTRQFSVLVALTDLSWDAEDGHLLALPVRLRSLGQLAVRTDSPRQVASRKSRSRTHRDSPPERSQATGRPFHFSNQRPAPQSWRSSPLAVSFNPPHHSSRVFGPGSGEGGATATALSLAHQRPVSFHFSRPGARLWWARLATARRSLGCPTMRALQELTTFLQLGQETRP